ncbi:MAG: hypothetical protein GY778_12910 [bacterium]|nr:hypothetical protein [bacterium]
MENVNLHAAWIGILLGFLAGAIQGLFFQNDQWLGGYSAWSRRMTRLGHVSFFGIAFVNMTYALTVRFLDLHNPSPRSSWLFIVGAATMPLVCYLSAYRKWFRHLFPLPVLSLIVGAALFIWTELLS